jgi:hypothetical protein
MLSRCGPDYVGGAPRNYLKKLTLQRGNDVKKPEIVIPAAL